MSSRNPDLTRPRRPNRSSLTGSAARWTGIAALLLCGCGGGIPRVEVSGTVTLDGEPLLTGAILFHPAASGVSAGGSINNGAFHISRREGPSPGSYRVEIVSYRPTGRQLPDTDVPWSDTREELVPLVPERYNQRTQLHVEVSADEKNHFDFSLSSDARPVGQG